MLTVREPTATAIYVLMQDQSDDLKGEDHPWMTCIVLVPACFYSTVCAIFSGAVLHKLMHNTDKIAITTELQRVSGRG
jgi:hypothetical protein